MDSRFESMDLLRSLAIVLVILAHSVLSYGAPSSLAPLQLGGTGVDLFFVLSGWLLGSQLFKEADAFDRVDVRRFWYRRWMRTFPAYFVVLLLSLAQRYATKTDVSFPLEYFVFVQNYHTPLEFFSISWSLAVEEQFYLVIAPVVAAAIAVRRGSVLLLLVSALLLPTLFRMLDPGAPVIETHVRFDGCVAGVLLAFVSRRYSSIWSQLCRYAPVLAVTGLSLYCLFFLNRYFPEWSIPNPSKLVLALVFASWVLFANASDKLRRCLYVPGAQHVATRSYAMYLLHPESLALLERMPFSMPFLVYFILTLLITLVVSEPLYRFVELPFMHMRERYSWSCSARFHSESGKKARHRLT